jgi:hypothetical protein
MKRYTSILKEFEKSNICIVADGLIAWLIIYFHSCVCVKEDTIFHQVKNILRQVDIVDRVWSLVFSIMLADIEIGDFKVSSCESSSLSNKDFLNARTFLWDIYSLNE